jgi:polyisoprenoid-binding protein YceI
MKQIRTAVVAIAVLTLLASCGSRIEGDRVASGDALEEQILVGDKQLTVDIQESFLEWTGSKPTGKHDGTVLLREGTIDLSDGNLIGGRFVLEMNTIKVLDIEDPETNEKLRSHLVHEDFFNVDSFPTATFVITGVEAVQGENITHRISGNLTMRGVTRSIAFNAHVKTDEHVFSATTPKFILNRAEWNVRYGSRSFFNDLKDNFVHDDIGLKINLTATL